MSESVFSFPLPPKGERKVSLIEPEVELREEERFSRRGRQDLEGSEVQENDIYIGRPSKWGNPYKTEQEKKYYQWLSTQPDLLTELPTLKGKRLLCHGHIIGLTMLQRGIN